MNRLPEPHDRCPIAPHELVGMLDDASLPVELILPTHMPESAKRRYREAHERFRLRLLMQRQRILADN